MTDGQPVVDSQKLVAFLATATLDKIIPRARVSHFPPEALICSGDQLDECAFLVLKGSCELRRHFLTDKPEPVQGYREGEAFGGFKGLSHKSRNMAVIATDDSIILGIRLEDLAEISSGANGHETTIPLRTDRSHTTFFYHPPKGRLVTLLFLSDLLPARMLAEGIGRRLNFETNESVALVRFVVENNPAANSDDPVDIELAGELKMPLELRAELGLSLLTVSVPRDPPDPEILDELFRRLRRRFMHVLVAASSHLSGVYLAECVRQSIATYPFLRRSPEDLYRLDLLLHDLKPVLDGIVVRRVKPVLCLGENEFVAGFEAQIEKTGISTHAFLHGCPKLTDLTTTLLPEPTKYFPTDIRRLARDIGNCLVGLALSSGGAKGFAHIGVLQVLEENGVEVDVVAGSSMGAYVGSIWAHGHDGDELEKLAREMEGKRAMWSLLDPVLVPWQGFLRGFAVKRRLKRTIGDAQFADLPRTLRVIAAHLETMERIVFSSGDVATAVHASIAVPGICIPVKIGDEYYVDGGIVDPLPTDVLQEMGVRKIIAVNMIPTPERIRYCLQMERELASRMEPGSHKLVRKLMPFNQYVNHYSRGNVLEILMHSTHGAQIRVAEASCRSAAIVLRPDICDDRWLDFRNPGNYIKAGRDVALLHLDEIKTIIKQKGVAHEHEPSPHLLATVA